MENNNCHEIITNITQEVEEIIQEDNAGITIDDVKQFIKERFASYFGDYWQQTNQYNDYLDLLSYLGTKYIHFL